MWAEELIGEGVTEIKAGNSGLLPGPTMVLVVVAFALAAINRRNDEKGE